MARSNPVVLAKATGGSPKQPTAFARLVAVVSGAIGRIKDLEAAVRNAPVPRDGMGVARGLVDGAGNLVLVRTDGELINCGPIDLSAMQAMIDAAVAKRPPAEPGTSVTLDEVRPLIAQGIAAAVADLPPPEPGKPGTSVTVEDVTPLLSQMVDAAVAKRPPAEPGTSVTLDEVRPLIAQGIAAAVADLPPPEPGKPGTSVTVEDVTPLLSQMVDAAVGKIPPARDGVGIADVVITAEGRWAVSLADGRRLDAGPVPVPQPGAPGRSLDGGLVDADGNLVLAFSDGSTVSVGRVTAEPGVSIAGGMLDENGVLTLTLTDTSTVTVRGSLAVPKAVVGSPTAEGVPEALAGFALRTIDLNGETVTVLCRS